MSLSYRLLGDASAAKSNMAHGRLYTAGPGEIITVPAGAGDVLRHNGWTFISLSAPTASRPRAGGGPSDVRKGDFLWDETIGALLIFDGAVWRDPATGNPA